MRASGEPWHYNGEPLENGCNGANGAVEHQRARQNDQAAQDLA
jgi:hypothetical protein